MKKTIQLCCLLLIALLSSCATKQISLDKTVWFNASPSENNGQEGTLVTSLYFTSSEQVDIYNSVIVDTTIIIEPFLYATGKYETEQGDKVNTISINAKSIDKNKRYITYTGYYKKDDLFLINDSICIPYLKISSVKRH